MAGDLFSKQNYQISNLTLLKYLDNAKKRSATENPVITWLYLTPWIITLLLFWLYPLIYSLYLSFTKYSTLSNETVFIGFDNYKSLFNDTVFLKALSNTLISVVGTIPFTTICALALAIALNQNIRWKNFYRSAYFIPSVTSIVVLSLIFTNLFSHDGYLNSLLKFIGIPYPKEGWLMNTGTALLAIMGMDVWIAIGYYVILFLAALQTIPSELYEASSLDGADNWNQFKNITLPSLKPMLLFIIVINTIRSFQVFTEIYVMTKGGPLNSTTTLVYQVFENAFEKSDKMGYASAIAYVVFLIILVTSIIQRRILTEK